VREPKSEPKNPVQLTMGSRFKDYAEGFRIIAKNRFLRNSIAVGLIEMLATDAFMLLVLPGFISGLGGHGGFGTLMAASAVGSTLAGLGMIAWGSRKSSGEPLKRLERDGKISYLLAAAGALLSWGVYASHGVWAAAVAYGLSTLLMAPSTVVWTSLVQHTL